MIFISILVVLGTFSAPQSDLCKLLAPADVAALLGGPRDPKPIANFGCTWAGIGPAHKEASVLITVPELTEDQAKSAFKQNETTQQKDARRHTRKETGLGDAAFSGLPSYGVIVEIMKDGRLLKVQYNTNAWGTEAQRTAVLAVAKKAAAKF
jgi:hypothetical protein